MADRKHRIELISPAASPDEAAAIVAALERFLSDNTPVLHSPSKGPEAWKRTAMLEAVTREGLGDMSDPWINT